MRKIASVFSVRNSLLGVVAILTLGLAAVTGKQAFEMRAEYARAGQAETANRAGALMTEAALHWARERAALEVALAQKQPIDPTLRDLADAARAAGDAAFEEAVTVLDGDGALPAMADAFEAAGAARDAADSDAGKALAERGEEAAARWAEAMTGLTAAARDLRHAVETHSATVTGAMARLALLKNAVGRMGEHVTVEAAVFGTEVARAGLIATDTGMDMEREGGQIAQALEDLQLYATGAEADPRIARAVAALDEAYGGAYGPMRDKVLSAGSFGSSYPVDAAEWFALTGGVLDALTALNAAIAEAEGDIATAALDTASQTLAVALFMLGVAVAAGLASLWLVLTRVIHPVAHITRALGRLAGGDSNAKVRYQERGDEMGRMARALEELRQVVGEAFRLQQMVEAMPLSVMTCDARDGMKVNYLNAASKKVLEDIEAHIPVPWRELEGQPVDVYAMFDRDPATQRALLADPENMPLHNQFRAGPEWIDIHASPIHDRDGTYLGPMITWTVITERIKLAEKFEENVKGVVEAVSAAAAEMQSTARSMSGTAEETSSQATAVSAASEQASASVQTVASAAEEARVLERLEEDEEMSSSVQEIGSQASRSTEIASRAVNQAEETNRTVSGLNEAATKIGEVIGLISDIAEQTNLLALNATIEAARAGAAGKGFAVVADEVKALATQTAQATEEIAKQIAAMQTETKAAVTTIGGIGETVAAIDDAASAIASAVEQQAASIQEIARNAQQAAKGTEEVSSTIGSVTVAAGETGSAAQQVLTSAEQLSKESEVLRKEVEAFLAEVRAA